MNLAITANVAILSLMISVGYNHAKADQEVFISDDITNMLFDLGVDAPVVAYSREDTNCLAKNIYFEARNQDLLGQRAVGWVTLNRVAGPKYPDTVCDVVWDEGQFSWTSDGNSDTPKNKKIWDRSLSVAIMVMNNHQYDMMDPTENAVMFHADYVDPYWASSYEKTVQIDTHIFYKEQS